MVRADSLNAASLIRSMEEGLFYASTGVILEDIHFKNNTLRIRVEKETGVKYRIQFIGYHRGENQPDILQETEGPRARFTLTEDVLFVRAKVVSSKLKENATSEGEYEVAWGQPVFPPA